MAIYNLVFLPSIFIATTPDLLRSIGYVKRPRSGDLIFHMTLVFFTE